MLHLMLIVHYQYVKWYRKIVDGGTLSWPLIHIEKQLHDISSTLQLLEPLHDNQPLHTVSIQR